MNCEYIREKVFEVYKECDIRIFPIDCFEILEHYGLRIFDYQETKESNPELYDSILKYSKDAFRFRMSVYYNSLNTFGRIRFSLMHELGHFILEHSEETPDNEEEADYFASNMLAPRIAIQEKNYKTAEEIHDYFGLSYAAANRTLIDYKKWAMNEISPSDKSMRHWIFYPNYYRQKNLFFNRIEKNRKKTEKRLHYYDQKYKFLLKQLNSN